MGEYSKASTYVNEISAERQKSNKKQEKDSEELLVTGLEFKFLKVNFGFNTILNFSSI